MSARADYARMGGERLYWQAAPAPKKGGGYKFLGKLWDEFKVRGWRPVHVNPRTGYELAYGAKGGVWVFRYVGYESDDAVQFARRVEKVVVKSRPLRSGED